MRPLNGLLTSLAFRIVACAHALPHARRLHRAHFQGLSACKRAGPGRGSDPLWPQGIVLPALKKGEGTPCPHVCEARAAAGAGAVVLAYVPQIPLVEWPGVPERWTPRRQWASGGSCFQRWCLRPRARSVHLRAPGPGPGMKRRALAEPVGGAGICRTLRVFGCRMDL